MAPQDDLSFSLDDFSGTARLFPLPNLVLFPHVMQPLHIFEPRYRDLLEDAVEGDHLIAMATLKPGWEHDYEGNPPVYPVACLGRINVYHALPDGGYNLLLLGLRRIRIVRELPGDRRFRVAEAQVWEDLYAGDEAARRAQLHQQLRNAFLEVLPRIPQAHDHLDQLLGEHVPLGMLTDVVSYMIDLDLDEKESLLAETSVVKRAERLVERLQALASDVEPGRSGRSSFPPDFSAN